jgi:uncharacterized protein
VSLASERQEALRQALSLWNRQAYFECHEVLEEQAWKACPEGDERLFYHGLIQVAVGLVHWQRGNAWGAHRLLGRGVEKLRRVAPLQGQVKWMDTVKLDELLAGLEPFLDGHTLPEAGCLPPSL